MVDMIKEKVEKNKLTYAWLRGELAKRGCECTAIDLSNIFGAKADTIIRTSYRILTDYEMGYATRND